MGKIRSTLLWAVAALLAPQVQAATPVSGLWVISSEFNGQPGRGFQITIENDVLVFSYYGYNANGSATFLLASGPLVNNVFTGELYSCTGGTVIGGPAKPATCAFGLGSVRFTFTNGERGTIALPGEAIKPIQRFNFGYSNGPNALLGTFLFAYQTPGGNISEIKTLSIKTGESTSNGNGIVSNAAGTFVCEFQSSVPPLRDMFFCGDFTKSQYDDIYLFRMVGDRGAGYGSWTAATKAYPLEVVRLVTAQDNATGPYEFGSSFQSPAEVRASATSPVQAPQDTGVPIKLLADNRLQPASLEQTQEQLRMAQWQLEVSRILAPLRR